MPECPVECEARKKLCCQWRERSNVGTVQRLSAVPIEVRGKRKDYDGIKRKLRQGMSK